MHDFAYSVDIKGFGDEIYIPLIRWIRCMLAREFHISCVLTIWDVIFANGSPLFNTDVFKSDSLHMLDFVCLAMILLLKNDLMAKNNEKVYILKRFSTFPPVEPTLIISNALKLKKEHL